MDVVVADEQSALQVRTLSGSATGHHCSVRATLVPATLVSIQGATLTVRSSGDSELQPAGTLVEIITPDRYYLGEIASLQGDTATIVTEHELERSAVEAIQIAWGGSSASFPGDSGE